MIVVSDTSPLNYLVLINAIDVLPKLFGEVFVPPSVVAELQHMRTPAIVKDWIAAPPHWLRIQAPSTGVSNLDPLDAGEAAAIALAKEIGASAVLIDEKKGRSFAKSQGLAALGTITVLELAADQDLVRLDTAFSDLANTTFQITQELLDSALARHAARKKSDGH
jgi:predicted nucleic acid-binding protein